MIAYLRGRLKQAHEDWLILDVGGVGYEVFISTQTLGDVVDQAREIELWIHTQVREDTLTLYGFSSTIEKDMFLSLLKVNGIGPKMALRVLSGSSLKNLIAMIEESDVRALSKIPKVGKKTAEQMVLALKGRFQFNEDAAYAIKRVPLKDGAVLSSHYFVGVRGEIFSALVNLGFKTQEVEPVVSQFPDSVDLQSGIRRGLQALTGS